MEIGMQKKQLEQCKRRQPRREQSTAGTSTTAVASGAVGAPQQSAEIWIRTYTTLVQWHQAQMRRFCGGQLNRKEAESCSEEETEEDDDEEESCEDQALQLEDIEEEEEVDKEYLKCLEITMRHRLELKRSREAAAVASTEA